MSMSKKDFVVIAEQIKFALRDLSSSERSVGVKVAKAVADGCQRCNYSFDRERFYEACEITQEDLK